MTGTAVFVGIGSALTSGGPLSLLLGFMAWSSVMWAVNEGQAEMVCQLPIESSFVRFAGRYVDEAAGVALGKFVSYMLFLLGSDQQLIISVGYTYTIGWMALVCFEIVSFGIVLGFWTGPLDNWAKCVIVAAMVIISFKVVCFIQLTLL